MNVIGFSFTKISAEKNQAKITSPPGVSLEFTNLEKEPLDILKDAEAIKVFFKHSISYQEAEKKKEAPQGAVNFEGSIVLSVSKEEAKELFKSWKKKQLPPNINIFLFNLILKKCTPKAVFLEDEVNLPFHTPMPKFSPKD